ncbi:MAG: UDP-N-acetylmuramate--L-alanine ligase [Candidatus Kuenenbacteria bacterium]
MKKLNFKKINLSRTFLLGKQKYNKSQFMTSPKQNFENKKKVLDKIHFIGIGGIMMSALGLYFLSQGKIVSGSDRDTTEITDKLISQAVKVHFGHNAQNIPDNADLVIYTAAVSDDNPELAQAKKLKIPLRTVYQLLGEFSISKYTISISGMHGKSTITSMLGLIAEKANLDPTVFVGANIKEWQSNFRAGSSKYLITEACEYKDNFLSLVPDILVINNIEEEHLDYFKNIDNIKKSFLKLIYNIKDNGILVINADDKLVVELSKNFKGQVITYGLKNKADFRANNLKTNSHGETEFTLNYFPRDPSTSLTRSSLASLGMTLGVPGIFNVYNALAAIAASSALGIKLNNTKKVLENFTGIWRRFEFVGEKNGIQIYDDYAHHPTEIKATLTAAKEKFKNKNFWVVFQPHLYSRTKDFLNEFADSLNLAPHLIITDIYAAREKNECNISSKDLAELINKKYKRKNPATYIAGLDEVGIFLKKNLRNDDILLTMGAGDVFKAGNLYH